MAARRHSVIPLSKRRAVISGTRRDDASLAKAIVTLSARFPVAKWVQSETHGQGDRPALFTPRRFLCYAPTLNVEPGGTCDGSVRTGGTRLHLRPAAPLREPAMHNPMGRLVRWKLSRLRRARLPRQDYLRRRSDGSCRKQGAHYARAGPRQAMAQTAAQATPQA